MEPSHASNIYMELAYKFLMVNLQRKLTRHYNKRLVEGLYVRLGCLELGVPRGLGPKAPTLDWTEDALGYKKKRRN